MDLMTKCSAHKAMCLYPSCPDGCTGRAVNWDGNKRELLEIAATSDGLLVSEADRLPLALAWLLDNMLIWRDYNRYRASASGLKVLFPSMLFRA